MVIALIATMLLLIGLCIRWRQSWSMIDRLAHKRHRAVMLPDFSPVRFALKYLLLVIAVVALGMALARPRKLQEVEQVQHGRDVMVILDVSQSMLVRDGKPDRLSCAREKIARLLERLKAERVGLLIFAGSACVLCPLTNDYETVRLFLDDISQDSMSPSPTSLMNALKMVKKRFDAEGARIHRTVLVVTDGEDFSEDDPGFVRELCDSGIQVAALVVGTPEGGPIPDVQHPGSFIRDEHGVIVISRREQASVEKIVSACSGRLVPVDLAAERDVDALVAWIDSREAEKKTVATKIYDEWYAYPAALAVTLLLLEWVV